MTNTDPSGAKLISLERTRQQKQEGYHISHDAAHDSGELGRAAIGYIASALKIDRHEHIGSQFPADWD